MGKKKYWNLGLQVKAIREDLGKGKMDSAINRLNKIVEGRHVPKKIIKKIRPISARYENLNSQKIRGVISYDEEKRERASITESVFLLTDIIGKYVYKKQNNGIEPPTEREGSFKRILISVAGASLSIVFLLFVRGTEAATALFDALFQTLGLGDTDFSSDLYSVDYAISHVGTYSLAIPLLVASVWILLQKSGIKSLLTWGILGASASVVASWLTVNSIFSASGVEIESGSYPRLLGIVFVLGLICYSLAVFIFKRVGGK